jgi:polyphenol oxidase
MLPQPRAGFRWVETAAGPSLVCEPLEFIAQHLFTTRTWMLASTTDGDRTSGWRQVAEEAGVDEAHLVRARQVHGASVVIRGRGADAGGRDLPEADILISDDPDAALAIQTADCVPLLIADPAHGAVAAAHAGWRGLAARVPERVVQAMTREFGCRPADLIAAIGPSISGPRYEVGYEVWKRFEDAGFPAAQVTRWFVEGRPEHAYFDGWQSASDQLEAAGVPSIQIHVAGLCTSTYPDVFCSYRRDGTGAGRLAAVIRAKQVRSSKAEVRSVASDF